MDFLWEQFNIKTFPSRAVVFCDGEFRCDLSDESAATIKTENDTIEIIANDGDEPVHIICVGELSGAKKIIIKSCPTGGNSNIYFSLKAKNEKPAFLSIFVENTGKNTEIHGDIVLQNYDNLRVEIVGDHLVADTGIFIKTRVLAHEKTTSELIANANIVAGAPDCNNDISFSVMAAPDAKIKMIPAQKLHSVPTSAEHAAAIYRGTDAQIEYLSAAGLSAEQISDILEEAFLN